MIGAGHAGCEAAYAAARLGAHVGLCTLTADTVAHMPCNPAVGGTAKGHLVREIDALGGLMGRAIDATGIQFKLLNRSRGPAVWSPRAQADKKVYGHWIRPGARVGAEHRVAVRQSRPPPRRTRSHRRARHGGRRRVRRGGSCRDDRDVPGRPRAHWSGAAAVWARGRAAVDRARGVVEVLRFRARPAQDRNTAEARPLQHRLRSSGGERRLRCRARGRAAGAIFVSHASD